MAIVLENKAFLLTLGDDCIPQNLICKATGEDCLSANPLPLFSLTEDRPFNNEIKLIYPNKRTTFRANRVRREGDLLIVGFDRILFEAAVRVKITDTYMAFTLEDFIVPPEAFGDLTMTPPPVAEFRLLQLSVAERKNFGEWLNVAWDDRVAVNVLATSPHARIDSGLQGGDRLMCADAVRGVRLKGCTAALTVCRPSELLDVIDGIEIDYGLPRGAKARRGEHINESSYWVRDLPPETLDTHIEIMKKAGIKLMLIYYKAFFKEVHGYRYCGDYDYNDYYPNGAEDLRRVLKKLKDAGITPGIHFLHSHIGILSRYVTPTADPRLNHTARFTLKRPLTEADTEIFVEENPDGCVLHPDCRVLQFGTELIGYESYTTEPPYRFLGCDRGHFYTVVTPHEKGQVGGLLDISEFGATSVYLDQNTDLQDEVGAKLAAAYACGFEFVYFDGSEGTNPPFDYHIPNAQYRVYRQLNPEPIFCEGAAKSHFGWHMLSGGNAFDLDHPLHVPTADRLKPMVAKYPLAAAPRLASDFTRLNFGWFLFFQDTQPDDYEYATSRAASWDCPVIVKSNLEAMAENPRAKDIFESLRRWEEVRRRKWLTDRQKADLRDPDTEHHLLRDETGELELVPYYKMQTVEGLSAFLFCRKGKTWVACWHTSGEGTLRLPIDGDVRCFNELENPPLSLKKEDGAFLVPVGDRRYLETDLSPEALRSAFLRAEWVD